MDSMRRKEVWNGKYRGVVFEIQHFSMEGYNTNCWTHYIYLHLDRIPEKYNPDSFWLKGEGSPFGSGKNIYYHESTHPVLGAIEFHGGCTWYSKESGFDDSTKMIKIGCDYQHYMDEQEHYNLDSVYSEVKRTIDSFLTMIPDYKLWCQGNGKFYDLSEGTINEHGDFYSNEYTNKEKERITASDSETNKTVN